MTNSQPATRGSSPILHLDFGLLDLQLLALITWIYLGAVTVVLCAEINVVRAGKLWPRSLMTPFSENTELTAGDGRAYASYPATEQHTESQNVDVDFDQPDSPSSGGLAQQRTGLGDHSLDRFEDPVRSRWRPGGAASTSTWSGGTPWRATGSPQAARPSARRPLLEAAFDAAVRWSVLLGWPSDRRSRAVVISGRFPVSSPGAFNAV